MSKGLIGKPAGNPDENLKRQAYGIAMYGTAEEYKDPDELVSDNKDDSGERFSSGTFGDGWEEITAPSTHAIGHPRRRALKCGYHRGLNALVIIFRPPLGPSTKNPGKLTKIGPEPWILYNEVDIDLWESLKNTHSTGGWLKSSGVEQLSYAPTSKYELDEMVASLNNQ